MGPKRLKHTTTETPQGANARTIEILPPLDPGQHTTALIVYDEARSMLQRSTTLLDVKNIHDRAAALKNFATQHKESLDMQLRWAEITVRCERRMGELLAAEKLHGGDRKSRLHHATLKLAHIGIEKTQSHRYQKMASLPAGVFEDYLAEMQAIGKAVTSAAILRLVEGYVPRKPSRPKKWTVEKDVDAIYRCVDRLSAHWQSAADIQRIEETLKGIVLMLPQLGLHAVGEKGGQDA